MLSTLQTTIVRRCFNHHLIGEEIEVQVENLAALAHSMVRKKCGGSILTPESSLFLPQIICQTPLLGGRVAVSRGPCVQLAVWRG